MYYMDLGAAFPSSLARLPTELPEATLSSLASPGDDGCGTNLGSRLRPTRREQRSFVRSFATRRRVSREAHLPRRPTAVRSIHDDTVCQSVSRAGEYNGEADRPTDRPTKRPHVELPPARDY